MVVPPLNMSFKGMPSKVSVNWPLVKERKVIVLRTPLGPVLKALIDGLRARIVCAFCAGEAWRMACAPMACSV
nr:hypothetical protein [Acidiferrobacter sp. SPIII_3]